MATKSQIPDPVNIMNAIRNEASAAYKAAVPVSTYANIQDVGNPILSYQSVQNEFLSALVNKIVLTIVNTKMYENPLAFLKKGAEDLGLDIEEIGVNPAPAKEYEPNNFQGILTPETPDVRAAYYRRNRQDKYKVTIKNSQLQAAFTSWNSMESLIAGIVNSLYNGNTIGEFNLTKGLVGDAVSKGLIHQIVLPKPTGEASATNFLTQVRATSLGMTFPSSNYTNYVTMNGGQGTPFVNWTPTDEQLIIVNADVAANVDVSKLSMAFNLSYADYVARQVVVDQFDLAPNMYAFVCDRRIFQIYEKLRKMTEFYNGEVMAWTYWFHCWDTYALSPFANGVAFVTAEYPVTPPDPTPGG